MFGLPDGVPALLGDFANSFLSVTALLVTDTYTDYGSGAAPLWGVFLNGVPVVVADTVTRMEYKQDWAIADYPVERGGFESYDKVNTPFAVRMQFASGGSEAKRQALLDSIVAIGDTLTLFDVVTPEAIYIGVNIQRYDYRRTSNNGLGLMLVDVTFLEIREEGTTDFKNAKSPSGFAAAEAGNVQSNTATTDIEAQMQTEGVQ